MCDSERNEKEMEFIMKNSKVENIIEFNKKIEEMILKTTSYFSPNEKQVLNNYDVKVIDYYQRILDLIIELANEEQINNLERIDEKYFKIEDSASMMIESYIETLEFYGNIDRKIAEKEINVIIQIQNNLKLDNDFEMKTRIQLADCYFHIGNEDKARQLMFDFIINTPDEDEAYMCMQNWYMYDKPDIDKLAEVIELAEKNNHILFTDFGYYRLVEYFKMVGDIEKQEKYKKLYDKWKNNRDKIE